MAPPHQELAGEDVARRLAELVAFDTRNPGGNERALVDHVARELERLQPAELIVRDVPRARDAAPGAYVFARWGTRPPRVLVNAHVDTVATGPGWNSDPLKLVVKDGIATGLGAADTKGAIAAILAALEDVGCEGLRDCAVLFSGDEEQGCACIEAFLTSEQARGIESAVICEPTSCRVGTRHRGILSFEVDATSEGGHSSRADDLAAPMFELAKVAVALGEWGVRKRGEGPPGFQGMCTNLAELRGGVGFNIVPPKATLVVSFRPPPGAGLPAIEAEIEALVRATSAAAKVRRTIGNPSFETRSLEAFRPLLGAACAAPIDLGFWTEAALMDRAGVNAVVYGPGSITQAHAANEWVPLEDLATARDAFAAVFRAAGLPSPTGSAR